MSNLRQKVFRVIENELNNIIKHQQSKNDKESKCSPVLANLDKNFSKKLKEHDNFMAAIRNSMKNTKQ